MAEAVLVLMPQGWLGSRDTVLHSGEGAVSTARWAGNLIAWANDRGVKARSQHPQPEQKWTPASGECATKRFGHSCGLHS